VIAPGPSVHNVEQHITPSMSRVDAFLDYRLYNSSYRALCGHLGKCGCDVSGCCFNCPLPLCRYDQGFSLRTLRSAGRTRQIITMRGQGIKVSDIAPVVGISKRSVYRLLAQ